MKPRTIRNAIRFENGMVGVYDQHGQQMPEYQGKYVEKREAILRDAPADAVFETMTWGESPKPIAREEW